MCLEIFDVWFSSAKAVIWCHYPLEHFVGEHHQTTVELPHTIWIGGNFLKKFILNNLVQNTLHMLMTWHTIETLKVHINISYYADAISRCSESMQPAHKIVIVYINSTT